MTFLRFYIDVCRYFDYYIQRVSLVLTLKCETRISSPARLSLTRVNKKALKNKDSMSIAQSSPFDGGKVADVEICNFTAIPLEALLQACGYALPEQESLGLVADSIDSRFDSTIKLRSSQNKSRSESIAFVGCDRPPSP